MRDSTVNVQTISSAYAAVHATIIIAYLETASEYFITTDLAWILDAYRVHQRT